MSAGTLSPSAWVLFKQGPRVFSDRLSPAEGPSNDAASHAPLSGELPPQDSDVLTPPLTARTEVRVSEPGTLGQASQFGYRLHLHFFHYSTTVNLDGLLNSSEVSGNLLV